MATTITRTTSGRIPPTTTLAKPAPALVRLNSSNGFLLAATSTAEPAHALGRTFSDTMSFYDILAAAPPPTAAAAAAAPTTDDSTNIQHMIQYFMSPEELLKWREQERLLRYW